MNIHILQHVPFEGPAAVQDWAVERGFTCILHKLYQGDLVPDAQQIDLLVILGGPMSANDAHISWITEERRLILEMIRLRKPIFGICLGAQQIAKALGSAVYQGEHKEVGWLPIRTVSDTLTFLPEEMTVLHWHGETFDLPHGAERLFSSEACQNQGFLVADHILGLQFHMEATASSVADIIEHDRGYLDDSRYVQSEDVIRIYPIPEQNRAVLYQLLDYICKL